MNLFLLILLTICILTVATLYSSVGHGGASGYIAVMALFSLSPLAIKPTALVLNVIVSAIATYAYHRAGHFRWSTFWPFAATSIPFSFLGGTLQLPPHYFKLLLGSVLLFAAFRLLQHKVESIRQPSPPPIALAAVIGALLGFLSGLTGVGGGIFLSPLLLLFAWASPRETAGVSALFILVNSIAGIMGHLSSLGHVPPIAGWLGAAAVIGGVMGSTLGSRFLPPKTILRALSMVLFIAGLKLILV